jgi:class 3 adenylate cyclase
MNSEADIRSILPLIRIPTLVVHRTGDRCLNVEEGRYLANRIPGADFVELPGMDHLPFVGDQDSILDEVEEFLTGVRHTPRPEPVLATLLSASFRLAEGESRPAARLWQRLRDHIDRELEWYRGRESGHATHTLLASFDGPARAIRCASAIGHHAARLGISMRTGVHIGECEIMSSGIRGAAVEIARRMTYQAKPAEILVSATVRDLVAGSGIRFLPPEEAAHGAATFDIPLLTLDSGTIH